MTIKVTKHGVNMSDPHNNEIHQEMWRDHWLADHPGQTAADHDKVLSDDFDWDSEYWKWRRSAAPDSNGFGGPPRFVEAVKLAAAIYQSKLATKQ
jgi:hypothetical protein